MKNRYLPFGYKIADGKVVTAPEQVEAVRRIFADYTAGQTFQQIANALSTQGIPYRSDAPRWNKNMVSRILANANYCGTAEYPKIITAEQLEAAEQIRKSKTVTYSATLKRSVKICNADAAVQDFTGIQKVDNGFAKNAECGRSRHKPRKLSTALLKNCDGSGRTQKSSIPRRFRRTCNQWKLPCWIGRLDRLCWIQNQMLMR